MSAVSPFCPLHVDDTPFEPNEFMDRFAVDTDCARGQGVRNASTFLTSCSVRFARQIARQGWHGIPKRSCRLGLFCETRLEAAAFAKWRSTPCHIHRIGHENTRSVRLTFAPWWVYMPIAEAQDQMERRTKIPAPQKPRRVRSNDLIAENSKRYPTNPNT